MQNDTKVENMQAMTEAAREYGVYSRGHAGTLTAKAAEPDLKAIAAKKGYGMAGGPAPKIKPGVCIPWEQKVKELPEITGDKELVRRIWEANDGLGNMYIWQCLLSF
jgi:hypothetical protein